MKELKLIVAMDRNQVIGNNNDLPWNLPEDLQHVKRLTTGHTIIMGRKNYESIGKPLPHRRNIILTRNPEYVAEGCEVFCSVEEVMNAISNDAEVFVFGGEEIYKLFLPFVTTMHVTEIDETFEGDTFFPVHDWSEWESVKPGIGRHNADKSFIYYFNTYVRKA